MTEQQLRIVEPRWICPALAHPGGAVRIGMAGWGPSSGPSVFLVGRERSIPLQTATEPHTAADGLAWVTARLPADLPPGRYSLRCQCGSVQNQMPHCLAVPRADQKHFTFVHMSDPHVLKGGGGRLRDRHAALRESIRRVNLLPPDFVMHTGDLITRYDAHKQLVSAAMMRSQMQQARDALLQLEAPLFLTPGNHDTGLPAGRAAWADLMGRPWREGTDDFSFRFGGCHFAVLESIQEYDPDTGKAARTGPTARQQQWLAEDIAAAGDATRRFLFTHYDYDGQLARLVATLPIDAVFYGHSAKRCFPVSEIIDGHLADNLAYRVVTIRDGQVTSLLGPTFDELAGH